MPRRITGRREGKIGERSHGTDGSLRLRAVARRGRYFRRLHHGSSAVFPCVHSTSDGVGMQLSAPHTRRGPPSDRYALPLPRTGVCTRAGRGRPLSFSCRQFFRSVFLTKLFFPQRCRRSTRESTPALFFPFLSRRSASLYVRVESI